MLLEDDVLHIAVSRGLPSHVVAAASLREGEGIAGWVLATREPLIVEDLEDRGPRARRHGVRSAMAVPIDDGDGIIGVLNVGSQSFHARFSATHLASLEAMGRIVAISLGNATAMADSQELYLDTVKALALALETKDPYSRGSTERVLDLTVRLGEGLGMSESELQALRVAALLHDIGMAAAGDLSAAGSRPLTTVERAMLKMHPVIAADVLRQTRALRAAVPIVYHHHEHFDGTGYVAGLTGDAIPLGARVLSVADAYVSMTSPRPYRDAMKPREALASMSAAAGSQFDPQVIDALMDLIEASVIPAG
jgi:HD-GYP domain-containing protein (c-di-GMP phosphodiesterase class II)